MEIKLIEGHYNSADALNIITEIIHIKIRFHESKISVQCTEEDIKFRERRIKQLQKDLFELQDYIKFKSGNISLIAKLEIQ